MSLCHQMSLWPPLSRLWAFLSLHFHKYKSLRLNSLSVIKVHKYIRTTHFTYKKIFSNMSEFCKIFPFLKNISLYLTLIRINAKVVIIMEGNHLAAWEFSGSNEIRIKLISLLSHRCERAMPSENMKWDNYVLAFHYDTSSLFLLPICYINLRKWISQIREQFISLLWDREIGEKKILFYFTGIIISKKVWRVVNMSVVIIFYPQLYMIHEWKLFNSNF